MRLEGSPSSEILTPVHICNYLKIHVVSLYIQPCLLYSTSLLEQFQRYVNPLLVLVP